VNYTLFNAEMQKIQKQFSKTDIRINVIYNTSKQIDKNEEESKIFDFMNFYICLERCRNSDIIEVTKKKL
jgi:hypothetical protein